LRNPVGVSIRQMKPMAWSSKAMSEASNKARHRAMTRRAINSIFEIRKKKTQHFTIIKFDARLLDPM
jgi:hypothetical protein